jgi:hypothetical protein
MDGVSCWCVKIIVSSSTYAPGLWMFFTHDQFIHTRHTCVNMIRLIFDKHACVYHRWRGGRDLPISSLNHFQFKQFKFRCMWRRCQ